jgi:hypothetical protein
MTGIGVIDHTVFWIHVQYSSIVWILPVLWRVSKSSSRSCDPFPSNSLDGEQALNYIEIRGDEHEGIRMV